MKKFIEDGRLESGLSFNEFFNSTKKQIKDAEDFGQENDKMFEYTKLNFHRSDRIYRTYKPSDKLVNLISNINAKLTWLVITENWCGDSAQILPIIARMVELNENFKLKIIERDLNLDIMDLYLTNGKSRSIPKLVVFDDSGKELFNWGPRPLKFQIESDNLKSKGLPHDEIVEKLHLWYGRNRGKEIENEIMAQLKGI